MAGDANALLSGTAMAVLVGAGLVIAALLAPDFNFGSRLILLILGIASFGAGLKFSKG